MKGLGKVFKTKDPGFEFAISEIQGMANSEFRRFSFIKGIIYGGICSGPDGAAIRGFRVGIQ